MKSSHCSSNLQDEDDCKQAGEGESHAVVLLDSSTAAKEGDGKDEASKDDDVWRGGEELITKKVQILLILCVDDDPNHHEHEARYLGVENPIKYQKKHRLVRPKEYIIAKQVILQVP